RRSGALEFGDQRELAPALIQTPRSARTPGSRICRGFPTMSINSALTAGASGLQAESSALAAISNDIANVNTVGYKGTEVDFQALVTASSGGAYSAGGVTTTTQQLVTKQGSTTQTSSPTDLAI